LKKYPYHNKDGGGLFLLVTKRNTKLWRLKYKFDGKEKLLALGTYPDVTLSQARELREFHKTELAKGINPSKTKKEKQEQQHQEDNKYLNTFKAIALQRLEKIQNDISIPHYKGTLRGFINDTFPYIGDQRYNKRRRCKN